MKDWWDLVLNSHNPNVIVMLSGGKDSIATMALLVKHKIPVTAIHFIHKWGETIPTQEAERVCLKYGVELVKYDFSDMFFNAIKGYTDGRPCLLCKKQMYLCLEQYLKQREFGWLAIGDNANDSTTIARMERFQNPFGDNLICSDYFGTEMGCELPPGMHVLRPLINMSAQEVEQFLLDEKVEVQRLHSTGDKYFEYHREGCPVQFVDNGYEINQDILEKLQEYNCKITEFARNKGIRASIHMPSTFVITIPKGFEKEAIEYMEKAGLTINHDVNFGKLNVSKMYNVFIELAGTDIVVHKTYLKLFNRFLERLSLDKCNVEVSECDRTIVCAAYTKEMKIILVLDKLDMSINLTIYELNTDVFHVDITALNNLVIEIFRTRKFKIK